MKLRTFDADDMQLAMQMVRETMGDEAIILATKQLDKKGAVQVTAACETDDVEYDGDNYDDWFASLSGVVSNQLMNNKVTPQRNRETIKPSRSIKGRGLSLKVARCIENILVAHGVNDFTRQYLLDKMECLNDDNAQIFAHYPNEVQQWFAALIEASFTMQLINAQNHNIRCIFIGAQGAGKTLSVAKIAADCVQAGQVVHVITVDNNKAGGVEQLAAITDILGVELKIASSRAQLREILSDIPLNETVLVDSAGANPYDFAELKALAEYANLIEIEPVLVYAAGGDPMEADEIARAFSFIGVEKMIITRTDCARRFGSILNALAATNLKIANITGAERIIGTFEACSAEIITKLFFSNQLNKQEYKIEGLLP